MKYDLIDNTFQQKNASAYQLSILKGMDSLVYSVFDSNTAELLVLKTVELPDSVNSAAFVGILRKENLLDLPFQKVRIGMVYPQTALVPSRLFNAENGETYLEELGLKSLNGKLQHDEIQGLGLQVVYPPVAKMETLLTRRLPTAKLFNGVTAFLLGCQKMLKGNQANTAYAHFFDHQFYLAIFEKDRLLFCNTFEYSSSSDVIYFILLALEQHNLNPEQIQLNLSGSVLENSDIYKMLYRYVLNIDFLPQPDFIKAGKKFDTVPPHFFFLLYSLALCK